MEIGENLRLTDEVSAGGQIQIYEYDDEETTYINREEALQLIEHLVSVFEILHSELDQP